MGVGLVRAATLNPGLPPGGNFDLSHWYLTLPESGAPIVPPDRLVDGYTNRSWFYTGPDGAMTMWCPVTGGTTSGSSFPRSELRELLDPGDTSVNWTAQGTHVLDGQCKILQLPSTGRTVIGQIHGYVGSAPALVLIKTIDGVINMQVRLRVEEATYQYTPLAPLVLGEMIAYQISLVDGLLTVTVNGVSASVNILENDPAWAAQTFYFKAGSYPQDNAGVSTEGSLVAFYDLRVAHGTEPVPVTIAAEPADVAVSAGASVNLRVIAHGTPPLFFQWFKDGSELPGATGSLLVFTNLAEADAGEYHVLLTNAVNAVTSRVARLTVLQLATALDNTNLVWTASGSPLWFPQAAETHDGQDAVQSGAIGHSQAASLQTTVTGPGRVGFWWKVSSEPGNDRLLFYIDGDEESRITGESGWQWKNFSVSSGTQVLKWTYSKNSTKTNGLDAAWLDQVQYFPNSVPAVPVIAVQPVGTNVVTGAKAVFSVGAIGPATLKYQWQFHGTNLTNNSTGTSGATTATLTLTNLQPERAGAYTVIVSNQTGAVTSAPALLILPSPPPPLTLADALDAPDLLWSTNGPPAWTGLTNATHDGTDAARSGAITNGASTSMQTTVTGPGTLTFWWKVSCETNHDSLRFYINDSDLAHLSGEVDWQPRTFMLPPGPHILKWIYAKNVQISQGQDRAWVDEVQFAPPPPETVVPAPVPLKISLTAGRVRLSWDHVPGESYQVLTKDSLDDAEWLELPVVLSVDGPVVTTTDASMVAQRFYQVLAR